MDLDENSTWKDDKNYVFNEEKEEEDEAESYNMYRNGFEPFLVMCAIKWPFHCILTKWSIWSWKS